MLAGASGLRQVRFRNGWLVAVVALGLGAAACKKSDDAKKTDPANDKVADKADTKAPDKGDKPDPVKAAALARGIAVHQFPSLKKPEARAAFESARADLALLAYVTQIVPE